jgi:hypothetical protein
MANVIGGYTTKFSDRYAYKSPTMSECIDMGWTVISAYKCIKDSGKLDTIQVQEIKQWCKDNIWWQDYVWSYSDVALKNPKDATAFLLKWS